MISLIWAYSELVDAGTAPTKQRLAERANLPLGTVTRWRAEMKQHPRVAERWAKGQQLITDEWQKQRSEKFAAAWAPILAPMIAMMQTPEYQAKMAERHAVRCAARFISAFGISCGMSKAERAA